MIHAEQLNIESIHQQANLVDEVFEPISLQLLAQHLGDLQVALNTRAVERTQLVEVLTVCSGSHTQQFPYAGHRVSSDC